MEDDVNEQNEETLEVASKTWSKAVNSASKIGYKEGIEDGSASVFQEGFDIGYKKAFKKTFIIGVYKGLASCLPQDVEHPEEIEKILTQTKQGTCYLCENSDLVDSNKSLCDIEECQKLHSSKIINILTDYFEPLLQLYNISKKDFEF